MCGAAGGRPNIGAFEAGRTPRNVRLFHNRRPFEHGIFCRFRLPALRPRRAAHYVKRGNLYRRYFFERECLHRRQCPIAARTPSRISVMTSRDKSRNEPLPLQTRPHARKGLSNQAGRLQKAKFRKIQTAFSTWSKAAILPQYDFFRRGRLPEKCEKKSPGVASGGRFLIEAVSTKLRS